MPMWVYSFSTWAHVYSNFGVKFVCIRLNVYGSLCTVMYTCTPSNMHVHDHELQWHDFNRMVMACIVFNPLVTVNFYRCRT